MEEERRRIGVGKEEILNIGREERGRRKKGRVHEKRDKRRPDGEGNDRDR